MEHDKLPSETVDLLTGKTHADNESYVIACGVFMNLLVRTERCKELFLEWEKMAGWYEPTLYLRAVTEEIRAISESSSRDWERLVSVMAAAHEANKQLKEATDRYDGRSVRRDALRYTREELGLPWKWLSDELVRSWAYSSVAWAMAVNLDINMYYKRTEPELPTTKFHFEPLPGEDFKAQMARLDQEKEQYAEEQKALYEKSRLKAGWPNDPLLIKRDVEWFFRQKIGGETLREIIDSYHKEINNSYKDGDVVKDPPDANYVKRRIRKAKRLLTLAP